VTSSEPLQAKLRRYERPREITSTATPTDVIPFAEHDAAISSSTLTPGARALLSGLLRVGSARDFPGGGAGIEYGSLLKTAARPDYIADHIHEAAEHLHRQRADLLLIPGMSGYPVGAMYALAARLPAVLLKKTRLSDANPNAYPAGAFVIPSYTGEGDVVMHADPAAVADIVASIVQRKLAEQRDQPHIDLELRVAGADDIIDKATMSQAVSESASAIGELAIEAFLADYRARTGESRRTHAHIEVVAWVTPLIKTYNNPQGHLQRLLGITPFAGLEITGLQTDPHAIGIEGVGMVPLREDG
jgi:hypothetical protein